jgi:hypothetical protein
MKIVVEVPKEADPRVTEAFCTDRKQDDETEQECINRIVTAYVNQVVIDYERSKAVEEAQSVSPSAPIV